MSIDRFSSPLTRMLLAGDGSTTLLLQALIGGPIGAKVSSLTNRPAAYLPAGAAALLQLAPGGSAFVRRSLLSDQQDRQISRNEVIVPAGNLVGRRLAEDFTCPIGLNLIATGTDHTREPLVTGLTAWDPSSSAGPEASSKVYLIHAAGRPLMLVWETFNPDIVLPIITRRDVDQDGVGR
ncbi:hypothetical protein [Nonomuraea zeae]|uniref:Uncharacterized protein n=1 Tax=Nonomuraea zeae TaxID=1642303 RepID=A0A5S4FSL8_9ACTN|nr:hypothetical protein [Nonomuraea zeae]TMR23623.1 hypothetical protein ETD85_47595 [Nonomuraea zeae]